MKRPSDLHPGIFLTDNWSVDEAVDVINAAADPRSAPVRRAAVQLIDYHCLHGLPLPPAVRAAVAKAMRQRRTAATQARQRALAQGEAVNVGSRSQRRLRARQEPDALWASDEPPSLDTWWRCICALKVKPPRVGRQKQRRHGKRHRSSDVARAKAIEARARLVRGRWDVRALPHAELARMAGVTEDDVKAWASTDGWKMGVTSLSMHPIINALHREARGDDLAQWIRVPDANGRLAPIDPDIIRAWRWELSAAETARLVGCEAATVTSWRNEDAPWSSRVPGRE